MNWLTYTLFLKKKVRFIKGDDAGMVWYLSSAHGYSPACP